MSSYKLDIDGSGAQEGSERIVRSFEDIKAAAIRMEGGVSQAARKASTSFSDLQKNVRPISERAIATLRQLGDIFKNFRAPSDAAVRNSIMFLQGLRAVGTLNIGRVSGIAAVLSAISGYRGPSANAGKNTLALLNALRFSSSFSNPRGLAQTLTALSGFKGPSAAGAKNTEALLKALAAFRAPRGLAAVATALNAIASAANTAAGNIGRLRSLTGQNMRVNINTSQAHANTNMLMKQQNMLQSAIFRTTTAWNALGGVFAAKVIVNAANDLVKIRAQLEASTGSIQNARVQFLFLREQTMRLGLDFRETARSYGFFLGAIKGSGLSLKEAQDVFRGFSVAARALQLSTSDVDGIFRALGQIMSKGKLQAEELRQQLGDRLPGAFVRFAKALDMTKPGQLDDALKKGAISGDKLKKAILEVSASLEQEFAKSADKMSKTVDAAFNRLRNTFAFTADEMGRGGLNDAIINLFDALRKFLESSGFDNAMKMLAAGFKFLGENIEIVANILGVLAVGAVLKWVSAATRAAAVAATTYTIFKELQLAVAAVMAGMGLFATASVLATKAMNGLKVAMIGHPLFLIATVIMGAVWAWEKLFEATEKNTDAINAVNNKMADGINYADAMIERYLNLGGAATSAANDVWELVNAINAAALQAAASDLQGLTNKSKIFGNVYAVDKGAEQNLNPQDQALFNRFAYSSGTGYRLRGNAAPQTEEEFKQLSLAVGYLKKRVDAGGPGADAFEPLLGAATARISTLKSISTQPGYKGTPYDKWMTKYGGDYNKFNSQGAGISGDPIEKKKKGPKSEAEKWAEELERNLRSAQKAITDIEQEAATAGGVVDRLLGGSLEASSAGAVAAAHTQLKTFEDTFDSVEKAQMGTLALAQQLRGQGLLGTDDISTYDAAKQSIISYYEELQKLAAARQKDADVAQTVASMRDANAVSTSSVEMLKNMSVTQAEVNKQQEIDNALIGTSIEKRAALKTALSEEIDKRELLKRQLEDTNRLREFEQQKKIDAELAPMMASGMKQEDLDYYREMLETRERLIQQGYVGEELRGRVALEAAILNQGRAMKELGDEYERERQRAADLADAIVEGFRDATQNGKDFLSSFKDMFKNLKNIILDFVLWNPLKRFLQDAIQGATAQGSPATGFTSTKTTSQGVNTLSGGAASIMGFAGNVMSSIAQVMGGGGGAQPSGATSPNSRGYYYDADGFLTNSIPVTGARAPATPRDTYAPIPAPQQQQQSFFKGMERVFNWRENQKALKDLSSAFSNGGKGLGAAIGPAVGAAMNAVAAYSMGSQLGKGFAKMIGGGFRTQAVMGGVAGGAAAGFSLGGPVGAAIGAVAGGILGFLKKKPPPKYTNSTLVVGADGLAVVGNTKNSGGMRGSAAQTQAAASVFNQFALDRGANLTPGSYGSFGSAMFGADKDNRIQKYFYQLSGKLSGGKPTGTEGVDYIKSTNESEVQAWALIQQVRKGMVTGLSDTLKTVFQNTKASSMEQLQNDIGVGDAYDQFNRASYGATDLSNKVSELMTAWKKLSAQAKALGLSEDRLKASRDRLMGQMRDEFNYNIKQGILELTNPVQAAFNDLVKEYTSAVENAIAVGGDLAAVEQYYGLKRAEIIKEAANTANNGILESARNLYNQLTASSASPLNAGTVLSNSGSLFRGLQGQIRGGDYSNVGNLEEYSSNYLEAARSMYGSSTAYFDVFKEVTDFLQDVMAIQQETTGSGGTVDVPGLPSLDSLVEEIYAKNQEVVDATGAVGIAVAEGSQDIVDAINQLGNQIYSNLGGAAGPGTPVTSPVPTGGGGSGVGSTGGVLTDYSAWEGHLFRSTSGIRL